MMIRKREHHQSILLERASRRRRVGCVTLLPRLVRVPPRFVSCRFDERKTREYFARANTYVHVITLVLHPFFPLSIPKPHSIIELCCAQKTRLFFFFDLFFVSIFSTNSDKSLFYDDDDVFFVVVVYDDDIRSKKSRRRCRDDDDDDDDDDGRPKPPKRDTIVLAHY